ncbi:9673_t:CDS:2 [Ambispora leptoticha]|uniref:9673_t:CDS:1 n=1 Tax=Ambispora leptoticha TaxID=144679 RepID=A0A9N8W034_9GLOM|nr:9673_t:CDS:2 [Ambispora leptoticha]
MAAAIETPIVVSSSSQFATRANNNSQEQYQRSFFRRAWDKLEDILVRVQNKNTTYQDDDDILEEEFHNPLNPHRRQALKEGSIKSRISTDSGKHYDPWQQRINEELQQTQMEHVRIKNMISGWASDEVAPWLMGLFS